MATDGDATLEGVLASLNLSSYAQAISEEGFEGADDLAELTDDEATALGGDLGMKRGEVRLSENGHARRHRNSNRHRATMSTTTSPPR